MSVKRTVHGSDVPPLPAAVAMDENTAVYEDSSGYLQKAKANSSLTVAHGIVASAVTSDDVTAGGDRVKRSIIKLGIIDGLSGLTPGGPIYLSAATAGALTQTEPAAPNVSQCVGFAISATQAFISIVTLPRYKKRIYTKFQQQPAIVADAGGGAATGTAGDVNVMIAPNPGGEAAGFELTIKGTQTIVAPVIAAGGLDIGMDQTDNDGVEIDNGIVSQNPLAHVVGTDGRAYVKATFTVADASGCDPLHVGFRKLAARNADYTAYTDIAVIGIMSGDIKTETILNDGATTTTDTTDDWADGATKTLEVYVSEAGVVTYKVDGAQPTTVAAFTFDSGDTIIPFIFFLHGSDVAGSVVCSLFDAGSY